MPRIVEYEAPNLALPTADRAVEARSQAGRRVAAMYDDAGGSLQAAGRTIAATGARAADVMKELGRFAENQIAHREVSQGAAEFATLQDGIQREWNETIKRADPNDPSVAQQFLEERVRPQLEQFASKGFLSERGQRWAESHAISLQQHMWQKTAADMSTMAGLAVKVNAEQTINRLSSTVRQDPSSLDFALKTAETSIGGVVDTSPTLSAVDAAKARGALTLHAKETIVKSYLQGVAEQNPDEAVRIVESGKYADFVDGATAKQIIGYARTQARLAQSEERSTRIMREHTEKEQFNRARTDLEAATLPGEVGDVATLPANYWDEVRRIAKLPGATPEGIASMTRRGEIITSRMNKPEPIREVSQRNVGEIVTKIHNGEITTTGPIFEALGEGRLTSAHFKFAMKEFEELRTPEGQRLTDAKRDFLAGVKKSITNSNPLQGKMDPSGDLQYSRFQQDMAAKLAKARQDGKDPYELLNPKSPDYLGSPAALAPYRVPIEQSIREMSSRLRGGASSLPGPPTPTPPQPTVLRRNQGESIEAYRKRIGAGGP